MHRYNDSFLLKISVSTVALLVLCILLTGCAGNRSTGTLPTGNRLADYQYLIGPGDTLNIFVWRNPDVSANGVPVRPDGLISTPLVEDLPASGLTSEQVARAIEERLGKYIKDPLVTVTVVNFVGVYSEQIRVVGEAVNPAALPYRKHMSLLDVMLQVGGLTQFADGNSARIIRTVDGQRLEAGVRLDDLLKDGDISANLQMYPGDILIIPQAWF